MKTVWLALLYFNSAGSAMTTVEVATRDDCIRVVRAHESMRVTSLTALKGQCVQVKKP